MYHKIINCKEIKISSSYNLFEVLQLKSSSFCMFESFEFLRKQDSLMIIS